jgi:queuine/archaeosine tRNA-ribosyltransferase
MTNKGNPPSSPKKGNTVADLLKNDLKLDNTLREVLRKVKAPVQMPKFEFPSPQSFDFRMPDLSDIQIPTPQERNHYQSAATFMETTANAALEWKKQLPSDYRPLVLAILYGGTQVEVRNMAQVSFHGIQVEGNIEGSPCTLLAHQSTVQILCFAQKVMPETKKNSIGFFWESQKVEV